MKIHVTAIRDGGVYGHDTKGCNAAGCAGVERYFSELSPDDVVRGEIVEIDDGEHEHVFRPGPGGCDENPGVWATGGTTLSFLATCKCGAERREVSYGSQRNPGEVDYYTITEPDDEPADATRICVACEEPVDECPCGDDQLEPECAYCDETATTCDADGDPACAEHEHARDPAPVAVQE